MEKKPDVVRVAEGRYLEFQCEKFYGKIYLPDCELPCDVINYGFQTPYLCVFEEKKQSMEEAVAFAVRTGLADIAKRFGGSVVFFYPTSEGGWDDAPEDLFASIISESKIAQYYEDGLVKMKNRFTGEFLGYYIRGAVLRTCLYGYGKSADYIAKNCLKRIYGDGLYGKGDITPVTCVLERLSVIVPPKDTQVAETKDAAQAQDAAAVALAKLPARDIAVVSVGNSEEVNAALGARVDHLLVKETAEYVKDYDSFIKGYRRMMGHFETEVDLAALSMVREERVVTLATAADNMGDDKGTKTHPVGYVAYYNKKLMDEWQPLPTVLCFHGGGDSAMCMCNLSGWAMLANQYDFLLIAVENHLNSTATEMVQLIETLKERYPVDAERIYSTGFSMGGCKSWDFYQEYPKLLAGVAPMDATFEVGDNIYGKPAPTVNRDTILPVFYAGGEETPLPELPFQAQKCVDRMRYVFEVNQVETKYDVTYEERETWKNKIWGIDGDTVIKRDSPELAGRVLTMNLFYSKDGKCYTVFASVGKQQHEVHHHTCENAWKFLRNFRRLADGTLVGGERDVIDSAF